MGKVGDLGIGETSQRPTLPVGEQRTGWEMEGGPAAGSHQLAPSVEGAVCHREDCRAQLPARWGRPHRRSCSHSLPSAQASSSVRPAHPRPLGRMTNRAGTEPEQDRTECPLGRAGLEAPAAPSARREGMGGDGWLPPPSTPPEESFPSAA